ncbi:hypothetical protein SCOR_00505 [Sulfidibacter corallicola]|uniref:HEAT repeat domain-containing protein n=1 Tax=Sulfidibacter corallicola TaxID=2818388 RepID=A0A8A4TH85_SULCO|nr:hypothetical protein [Sulfidibacter corallicola]QTD48993.1 hypothetical protein J3U87_25695 [Sulfidibacter corallicola]
MEDLLIWIVLAVVGTIHGVDYWRRKKYQHPLLVIPDKDFDASGATDWCTWHIEAVRICLHIQFNRALTGGPSLLPIIAGVSPPPGNHSTGDPAFDGQVALYGTEARIVGMFTASIRRDLLLFRDVSLEGSVLKCYLYSDAMGPPIIRASKLEGESVSAQTDVALDLAKRLVEIDDLEAGLIANICDDELDAVSEKSLTVLLGLEPNTWRDAFLGHPSIGFPTWRRRLLDALAGGQSLVTTLPPLIDQCDAENSHHLMTLIRSQPRDERIVLLMTALSNACLFAASAHDLLKGWHQPAVPHVLAVVRSMPPDTVPTELVLAMGELEDTRIVDYLLDVLPGRPIELAIAAAKALGACGDLETIEPLARVRANTRGRLAEELKMAISRIQLRRGSGDPGWISLEEGASPGSGRLSLAEKARKGLLSESPGLDRDRR